MKRLHYLLIITSITLTAWACDSLDSQPETFDDVSLIGTEWELTGFLEKGILDGNTGPDRITLHFAENDSVGGTQRMAIETGGAYGNSYAGSYSAYETSLEISKLGSTKVGTPPGSRYREYLAALQNAAVYDIQGNRLIVYYGEEENALLFKAVETDK